MNTVAEIIGGLVKTYFDDAAKHGRDCRLLVPGITRSIARDVQSYLRSQGVQQSFLVVDREDDPDEARGWMYADGLTSKRDGSLIVVSYPGELAYIQDSIKGSGGAVRSIAFSDEWPWVDDGNESFRFRGPVLGRLLAMWTAGLQERAWLRMFILDGLLKATRTNSDRARLLFDELLGSFHPSLYSTLPTVKEKLLFHCGVPRPAGKEGDSPDFLADTSKLCKDVIQLVKTEQEIRAETLEGIDEKIPDAAQRPKVRQALETFFDGLGSEDHPSPSILGLSSCWGGHNDPAEWMALDTSVLRSLFNVRRKKEQIELTCRVSGSRGVNDEDQRTLATFHGETVTVAAEYKIGEELHEQHTCAVRLSHHKTELGSQDCTAAEGTATFVLDTSRFKKHKSRIGVKVQLLDGKRVLKESTLHLHLCGADRPAFLLALPPFKVVDPSNDADADSTDIDTAEVSDPVTLYLFHTGAPSDAELLVDDGTPLGTTEVYPGMVGRIEKTTTRVDPTEAASGQIEVSAAVGEARARLRVGASDTSRGAFTLEDELRVSLTGGEARARVQTLVSLFAGESNAPYLRLGNLDDRSRARVFIAKRLMETGSSALPVIADLFGQVGDDAVDLGAVRSLVKEGVHAFQGKALGPAARSLVDQYEVARAVFLQHVRSLLDPGATRQEHPVYASYPVFVAKHRAATEKLLVDYLRAYAEIFERLQDPAAGFAWHEFFALTYLDCVVHWGGQLQHGFFLAGPWHPLVVAKRFMIQANLVAAAARWLKQKGAGHGMHRLAVLLDQLPGFRWWLAVRPDAPVHEPAYASATEDPGWQLVVKTTTKELPKLLALLRQNFGLCSNLLPLADDHAAQGYLQGYLRAYPSRRRLGLRIQQGFSARKIVEAVARLLYDGEGLTEAGMQLAGGVHLVCKEEPSDVEQVEWRDPPVVLYTCPDDATCFSTHHPDIMLIPPTREVSYPPCNEQGIVLPRGSGDQAVLLAPLTWLAEGESAVPSNVLYEADARAEADSVRQAVDVPGAFTAVLGLAAKGFPHPWTVNRKIELPFSLRCPWAVLPGMQVDPAVFVRYIRDGLRLDEERALWSYQVDIGGRFNTYFILSTVPSGVQAVINGSPVLGGQNLARQLVCELGEIGVAIGGEAVKSGKTALGVLGLASAVRLFRGGVERPSPLWVDGRSAGFLLPVDSFQDFLGSRLEEPDSETRKRTDLLAVQLGFTPGSNQLLVSACAVECKYVSGQFADDQVQPALDQARQTLERFRVLVDGAREAGGAPERLALVSLLWFGMRLVAGGGGQAEARQAREREHDILAALLQGRFTWHEPLANAVLVTTEASHPGPAQLRKSRGWWVRVMPGHWPGVNSTPEVLSVCNELFGLFRTGPLRPPATPPSPTPPTSPETPVPPDVASTPSTPPVMPPAVGGPASGGTGAAADIGPLPVPVPVPAPAAPSPLVPAPHHGSQALRPFLLGMAGPGKPVLYDPQSPTLPLDNLNIMITGSAGKGKTQLVKAIVCHLRAQGKNVLMLDFKNDFASDTQFLHRANLESKLVTFDGLPYNPLIPAPVLHPTHKTLFVQSNQHINNIAAVLDATYNLGDQQEAKLRNVIREAFQEKGISPGSTLPYDPKRVFPDFKEVGDRLMRVDAAAINRLDPLFSLDIFRPEYTEVSFKQLLETSMVIDLSQIGNERLKNALAQIVVLSAHAYYNAQAHSQVVRQYFVLDEAHRVLSANFMAIFVRECRAYGVGVLLSSQYPSDFKPEISASMNTKVIHGNDRDEGRVREIVHLLGYKGDAEEIAQLGMFEALVSNKHYPNTRLTTFAYPLYLLALHLRDYGATAAGDLHKVPGLVGGKIAFLVKLLLEMGLAEEVNGKLHLRSGMAEYLDPGSGG